jgi:hypothetical protein
MVQLKRTMGKITRIKIFKSLCESCKKHCGGHFDIATVYQCDDWIKKEKYHGKTEGK